MFYSHEILTERKHGMAIVWLVATLGSKPPTRRVNKKAILGVDIPKACDVVIEPVAPMALRLQSSLLVGISRVFSSQCGYVLSDAEVARQNMRLLLQMVQRSQLDPDAGKARPEQLLLPDDPTFALDVLPNIDLEFPPVDFDALLSQKRASSSGVVSSQTSTGEEHAGGFDIASVRSSQGLSSATGIRQGPKLSDTAILDIIGDQTLLSDAGFIIDEDGSIIDESGHLSRHVLSEIGIGEPAEAMPAIMDRDNLDQIGMHDEVPELPRELYEGETYRRSIEEDDQAGDGHPIDEGYHPELDTTMQMQDSDGYGESRRKRARKVLPPDSRLDIRNTELQRWQTKYLANMRSDKLRQAKRRASVLAQHFAYHCTWGSGIADLGRRGFGHSLPTPLGEFFGDNLKVTIFGEDVMSAERNKRQRGPSDLDKQRNVRQRTADIEQGRAAAAEPLQPSDDERDIEIGREAETLLDDISSQMPWNILSSTARGSRAGSIRPDSRAGSVIRQASADVPLVQLGAAASASSGSSVRPLSRRFSRRLRSESPLQRYSRISNLQISSDNDTDTFQLTDFGQSTLEDFELFGPAAGVSTQTAAGSQWMKDTLRAEDSNFLDFVVAELDKQGTDFTTFAELLPPENNSRVVAAQGFLHILNLASSGLLAVEQDAAFDMPINIKLPQGDDP